MSNTIYLFGDVEGEVIQSLRDILSNTISNTYIGVKYDEDRTTDQAIFNVQAGSDLDHGVLRIYTISGMIISDTREKSVYLNELIIGAMRLLPRKMTILKSINIANAGTKVESGDGQKYMRGFNATLIVKANKKQEFIF